MLFIAALLLFLVATGLSGCAPTLGDILGATKVDADAEIKDPETGEVYKVKVRLSGFREVKE